MLEEMLRLVAQGEVTDVAELAARVGVSPALTAQMLEHLERLGYLTQGLPECASGCAGCSRAGSCSIGTPARLWALTPRGEAAWQRMR